MTPIIEVKNLSKKYRIGKREPYLSFRDSLSKILKKKDHGEKDFFALKNISFSVKPGETVGIIGRNGAGKSTLLKILSQITPPTRGEIILRGRIASLLEVGTGFHPELTGRENIYLNGAILGMSRPEISEKFNDIVEFAEVQEFLETPVKHYSSGMYMRLAFAVAAHLEPEILIIDEVLAVGDSAFQKKCLDKMASVAKEGRTILFVSHNLAAIENICTKGILIDKGKIIKQGPVKNIIDYYLSTSYNKDNDIGGLKQRKGSGQIRVKKFYLKDEKGKDLDFFRSGQNVQFWFDYELVDKSLKEFNFTIGIDHLVSNSRVTNLTTKKDHFKIKASQKVVKLIINNFPLNVGSYIFTVFVDNDGEIIDYIQRAGSFDVEYGDFYKTKFSLPEGEGVVFLDYTFDQK